MSFTLNRKAKQFYKLIASSEKEFADPTEEVSEKIRDYYLDQAYDLLHDYSGDRNGHYAFVCEKCAPVFAYYGYFLAEEELKTAAEEIYG